MLISQIEINTIKYIIIFVKYNEYMEFLWNIPF